MSCEDELESEERDREWHLWILELMDHWAQMDQANFEAKLAYEEWQQDIIADVAHLRPF